MKAGAASVLAVDIDPWTETAVRLNAALNGVDIAFSGVATSSARPSAADVYLAGDVFYDKALCRRGSFPGSTVLAADGATVLVGDPGRAYCPRDRMQMLATYRCRSPARWRTARSRSTTVWQFSGPKRQRRMTQTFCFPGAGAAGCRRRDADDLRAAPAVVEVVTTSS